MKNNLAIFLLSMMLAAGTQALAAAPGPGGAPMEDDDLGIEEKMKEEAGGKGKKKVKREVKKEELPPINMIRVKGGCFDMGDWTGNGDEDELPVHEVCIDDYYIGETEVTQELFEAVMGGLPSNRWNPTMNKDPQGPVNYVSFAMVQDFIKELNKISGGYYRLPTEAEWEYAAREGGKDIVWPGTNNEGELGSYAVFNDNSEMFGQVKSKKPNGLGLYGMAGNLLEWTEDFFDFDYYQESPKVNPYGPEHSTFKVVRGGSFLDPSHKLRTTYRYALESNKRLIYLGFRLAE